jgi:hypothetical protein
VQEKPRTLPDSGETSIESNRYLFNCANSARGTGQADQRGHRSLEGEGVSYKLVVAIPIGAALGIGIAPRLVPG